MSELFQNQDYGRAIYKHKELPIYTTDEFVFYRCISFDENFFGKTVSELHNGNLRKITTENRYSNIFLDEKISYWADSPQTARAEAKYHNKCNNILTFWSYDDATSTFPTQNESEPLVIIDGRESGFGEILNKVDNKNELTENDNNLIKQIMNQNPDCLVYKSLRKQGGLNYLFFEKGFKKLSIREVRLRLGDYQGKNSNRIVCAGSSDYTPYIESYGNCFIPLSKVSMKKEYKDSEEYQTRYQVYCNSLKRMRGAVDE